MNFQFEDAAKTAWKTPASVVLAHILLLFFIALGSHEIVHPSKPRLIVQTVQLQPTSSPAIYESTFTEEAIQQEEEIIEEAPQEEAIPEEIAQEEIIPEEVIEEPPVIEEKAPEPIPETKQEEVKQTPPPKPKATPKKELKKQPPKQPPKSASKPKAAPSRAKPVPKKQVKTPPKKAELPRKEPVKKASNEAAKKAAAKAQADKVAAEKAAKVAAQRAAEKAAIAKREKEKAAHLSAALSSLSGVEAAGTQKSSDVAISSKAPSKIQSLASESLVSIQAEGETFTGGARTYYDELVARLKLALKMPEYGEVRVKLTLARDGKVKKVTITTAKSKTNRAYIEKKLPNLSFPKFGDNFANAAEHTFCLNLSNELNY